MFDRWRLQRSDGRTRLMVAFFVTMSLLLVNAIAIAPADHHHGPEHDEQNCLTCILTLHGVWVPSATVSPAIVHSVVFLAPIPAPHSHLVADLPQPPVRGPPASA